jgi:predicted GIY-YIG superfamily endonuclease
MPAHQLRLFDPPRPLLQRLGEAFFRAVPRAPGVYLMTGRDDRVLYVGQSGNLRARLASYKNARPDHVPRKVIRLIHAVARITWETCESTEGARLRENELLRLHRPRFNRLNTWPRAYAYFRLRQDDAGFEVGLTHDPDPAGNLYGAFKARAWAGYGALLRLSWAVLHQPASPHDFPAQLLAARAPRQYRFQWEPGPTPVSPKRFTAALEDFLSGASDHLLQLLKDAAPAGDAVCPFQRALHARDLELLQGFFSVGPKRNHDLARRHKLASPLIRQEELDDLMA